MDDPFDVSLSDDELLSEVEMTTNLMIAASESEGPLSQAEVDRILGVHPGRAVAAMGGQEPDPGEGAHDRG